MNKKTLMELGLEEEMATKVSEAFEGKYVPKDRFNEVNDSKKALEDQIKDRDKQLEELKKVDGAALQGEIKKLQEDNKNQAKTHQEELLKTQKINALKFNLSETLHDPNDIISGLDLTKIELDDKGELKTKLDEFINPLKESKPYLFKEQKTDDGKGQFTLGGAKPADINNNNKPKAKLTREMIDKMTVDEMTERMSEIDAFLASNK